MGQQYRRDKAIRNASMFILLVMRRSMAQPTTARENRSSITVRYNHPRSISYVESIVEKAKENGDRVISCRDKVYPKLLRGLSDSPPILFVRGDVEGAFSNTKSIAVVGTRWPTEHGIITTQRITKYFACKGWTIVSGLAIGLDTIAHKTALECNARTAAVLAHGLDIIQPKQNTDLANSMVETGGVLVSEYPYNTTAFPSQFIERDRIQAGLARGVFMMQSDVKGGSWHASRAAMAYERMLLVPEPTAQDGERLESKIEGNRKIIGATKKDRANFLKCDIDALNNFFVIKGRNDYQYIEEKLKAIPPKIDE